MSDFVSKEKARKMRSQGMSINDVASNLKKNKSTVSNWCRDIVLNKKQKEFLLKRSKKAGAKKFIELNEKKRNERFANEKKMLKMGMKDIGNISKRDLFILGVALYWGEGYKNSSDECGFTNSDPYMIFIIMRWFREIYDITDDRFILRISVNVLHKKREEELRRFWSEITDVPKNQFTKTSFINVKTSKVYRNPEKHYGTLRIKVRKGTSLKRRILGSIKTFHTDHIEL